MESCPGPTRRAAGAGGQHASRPSPPGLGEWLGQGAERDGGGLQGSLRVTGLSWPGTQCGGGREAPFLCTVSSMSGCLVTITTLTVSVLPPWRIMFTTWRWPTFTTFCPFTCGTGARAEGLGFLPCTSRGCLC